MRKLIIAPVAFLIFAQLALAKKEAGLFVNQKINSFAISWPRPDLEVDEAAVLVRKENDCPKSPFDGEQVYRGNGNYFEDGGVVAENTYCYGLFRGRLAGYADYIGKSEPATKMTEMQYRLDFISNNQMIFWGIVIIFVLYFISQKTIKEKERIFHKYGIWKKDI